MSPQKIGKKLREIRLKLGLIQSEVVKKAELSTNYYARIERDEENPTIETLERILKVYFFSNRLMASCLVGFLTFLTKIKYLMALSISAWVISKPLDNLTIYFGKSEFN